MLIRPTVWTVLQRKRQRLWQVQTCGCQHQDCARRKWKCRGDCFDKLRFTQSNPLDFGPEFSSLQCSFCWTFTFVCVCLALPPPGNWLSVTLKDMLMEHSSFHTINVCTSTLFAEHDWSLVCVTLRETAGPVLWNQRNLCREFNWNHSNY